MAKLIVGDLRGGGQACKESVRVMRGHATIEVREQREFVRLLGWVLVLLLDLLFATARLRKLRRGALDRMVIPSKFLFCVCSEANTKLNFEIISLVSIFLSKFIYIKLCQLNQRLSPTQVLLGLGRCGLVSLIGVRPQILDAGHAVRKVESVADERSLRITAVLVVI